MIAFIDKDIICSADILVLTCHMLIFIGSKSTRHSHRGFCFWGFLELTVFKAIKLNVFIYIIVCFCCCLYVEDRWLWLGTAVYRFDGDFIFCGSFKIKLAVIGYIYIVILFKCLPCIFSYIASVYIDLKCSLWWKAGEIFYSCFYFVWIRLPFYQNRFCHRVSSRSCYNIHISLSGSLRCKCHKAYHYNWWNYHCCYFSYYVDNGSVLSGFCIHVLIRFHLYYYTP